VTPIRYQLVLEALSPEADIDRVREILRKLQPATEPPADPNAALPLVLARRFDLKSATEWMDVFNRSGVRCRIDVVTDSSDEPPPAPSRDAHAPPLHPWSLWRGLLTAPETTLAAARGMPHGKLWLAGLSFAALGEVLALPAQIALIEHMQLPIDLRGVGAVWLTTIIIEPLMAILAGALLLWFLLRMLTREVTFGAAAALAAMGHIFDPVKAVPLVGNAVAFFGWWWIAATGSAVWYRLRPPAVVGLLLLPGLVFAVSFAVMALAALWLLGDLTSTSREFLEQVPWP